MVSRLGDVHQLFPCSWKIKGQELNLLNGLDIASDGVIYFTDSSRFSRKDFILDDLEGKPHGRLVSMF